MKYVIFTIAIVAGVPYAASLAMSSQKVRNYLFAMMALGPAIGRMTSIHFVSMEDYRGPDRGFAVSLGDLAAWALGIYLISRKRESVAWVPVGGIFMVLFFIAACISATQAPMLIGAEFSLWKLIRLFIYCWVAMNMLKTGANPRVVYYGFTVMGLVFAGECFLQKYKMGMYRVNGFFDHSNSIPIFMVMAMPFVLLTALADTELSPKWVWAGVLSTLGMTFSIVATQSRLGIFMAAALLLITLVLVNIASKAKRTRLVSLFVFGCLATGGAMAAASIMNRIKTAPESSEGARVEFNIAADLMANDHPLGVGINNYSNVLSSNSRYNGHIEIMAAEIADGQAGVAHHIYKLTAAEMGRYALAIYLLLIGRLLLAGVTAWWRGRKILRGYQVLCLTIGSLAVHIISNMEWALRVDQVATMFALTCGLIAGYRHLNTGRRVVDRARAMIKRPRASVSLERAG